MVILSFVLVQNCSSKRYPVKLSVNLFDSTDEPLKRDFKFGSLTLHILPRLAFEAALLKEEHAAISILEPGQREKSTPQQTVPFRLSFLELDFAEVPENGVPAEIIQLYAEQLNRPPSEDFVFSRRHSIALTNFLDAQPINNLVVSCEAGVRRSPAVAACALEYLNMGNEAMELLANFKAADTHTLQVFKDFLSEQQNARTG